MMDEKIKKLKFCKVQKIKERYANEFINDKNEENYKRLNDFCREQETGCFLMKGRDFIYFPNDYTYNDHRFDQR